MRHGWAAALVLLCAGAAGAENRIILEVGGQQYNFKSVSGLSSETEVVEYREGGVNDTTHQIGRTRWPNIVLKQGFTGDMSFPLHNLELAFASGDMKRGPMSLTVLDSRGRPLAKWTVKDAWVSRWVGPELDSSKTEVSIETIEIAHEGIEYK